MSMDTKTNLLYQFVKNQGVLCSGEELATKLGVSRAAVWKAVEALRAEGIEIQSVQGAGYRLAEGVDVLQEGTVRAWLTNPAILQAVRVMKEIGSTNTAAKSWAVEQAPHGALLVAEKQTGGRGRLGRRFESPQGGIYMSVVLRPQGLLIQDAVLITAAASVAACRTIEERCGVSLGIKWVNDLFYNNKKCCGILTEAGTGFETGTIEYIVVGLGLNYTTDEKELIGTAEGVTCALFPDGMAPVSRAELIAALYENIMSAFEQLGKKDFLQEYRQRSLVLGKMVTVLANPPYQAKALEIDEQAQLVVVTQTGEKRLLSSGEISVRL